MNTAVRSLLGAVSLLALVGIRYPLKMLPVLFFEIVWKAIWILSFGLPLWRRGLLTGDFAETMFNCLTTVIILPFIPWDYVYRNYIKPRATRGAAKSEGKRIKDAGLRPAISLGSQKRRHDSRLLTPDSSADVLFSIVKPSDLILH
jgi:hypothetical protein